MPQGSRPSFDHEPAAKPKPRKKRATKKKAARKKAAPAPKLGKMERAPGVLEQIVSTRVIAYATGLKSANLQRLAREGVLKRVSHGNYRLLDSVRSYIEYQVARGAFDGEDPLRDGIDFNEARTLKMRADAERSEVRLAHATGEIVKTEDVALAWSKVLSNLRDRILAMPARLAPMVQDETDIAVIEHAIRGGIETALEELVSFADARSIGRSVEPETAEAAPAPTRKRVGRPRKKTKPRE